MAKLKQKEVRILIYVLFLSILILSFLKNYFLEIFKLYIIKKFRKKYYVIFLLIRDFAYRTKFWIKEFLLWCININISLII